MFKIISRKKTCPWKILNAHFQEVFHRSDRLETVNSAVAPYNR